MFDFFCGMFDFNRDGKTDRRERAMGLYIMDEMLRQEERDFGGYDDDDAFDYDDEDEEYGFF